jgi:hypothetical protein
MGGSKRVERRKKWGKNEESRRKWGRNREEERGDGQWRWKGREKRGLVKGRRKREEI